MPYFRGCVRPIIITAFLTFLAPSIALAQASELAGLVSTDLAEDEEYGTSVSIDGSRAIVGAPGGFFASTPGRALVFERDGSGAWIESAVLLASDGADREHFGESVAISGDRAIVGAPDAGGFSGGGAVYLFERNASGVWEQVKKFAHNQTFRGLGGAVAISGDIAVAGGTGSSDARGLAQVYVRGGCSLCWNYLAELRPSDSRPGDWFGQSVSIDGTRIVVGAPEEDAATTTGAAYVFERAGSDNRTWPQTAKTVASDASEGSRFGWSVSVDGDLAVVGASRESSVFSSGGAAYVFGRAGTGEWNEVQKLQPSIHGFLTEFGISASLSGTSILVGTAGTGNFSDDGSFLFLPDGTGLWGEAARFLATEAALGDWYGQSVAISGSYAVVGAALSDIVQSNGGGAWIFDGTAVGVGTQEGDLPATFSLSQNYPNPFNPSTTISFTLVAPSAARLTVMDMTGRIVRSEDLGMRSAGAHELSFQATSLPSGVYLYSLRAEGASETRRMVLLR